jgi:uncharacterized protein YndB with AHSA1/START domain
MNTTTHSVDAIVQEITIKAPAARVFEALVDPVQRMKWWGQKDRFETTNAESDLRPGGRWLMSGMGMGRPFKVEGVYRIIERPRVLAFTWLPSWDEEATETLVRFDLHEQSGVNDGSLDPIRASPRKARAHGIKAGRRSWVGLRPYTSKADRGGGPWHRNCQADAPVALSIMNAVLIQSLCSTVTVGTANRRAAVLTLRSL